MDYGYPGWWTQNTKTGGNVPTTPQKWLPLSLAIIAIWPADAVGGNLLTFEGIGNTPQLVNSTDFIDIGNEELNSIVGYALHTLAFKEGGARFESTLPYFVNFLQAAAGENDQLQLSAEFRHITGVDLNRQTRETLGSVSHFKPPTLKEIS
jgi:hypothetical protein